ncbi:MULTISPECIES: hypothetical protein [unclassified Serratia (in: enterobacteria)]|uniref:hypothetical protein n=1 Tax=unclassified Serratia (in: enterobacteria) TaxID=2647522 RepID=UPI0021194253|nr:MULTISPECIES: hypothetical protein [unclassified Serratia (in: enterobacteria)]
MNSIANRSQTAGGELAPNTDIANLKAQRQHAALGFGETERVVFYRKHWLNQPVPLWR